MGSAASAVPPSAPQAFRDAVSWYNDKKSLNDEELLSYLQTQIQNLGNDFGTKFEDIRPPSTTCESVERCIEVPEHAGKEQFMDSTFERRWLINEDADNLFDHLFSLGKEMHEKMIQMQATTDIKYPLSTITFGSRRALDGARALDRWGSYHESWCRVEEPTDVILKLILKARNYFSLSEHALNSVVVNYYWDGETTYIPAHRDTVTCLEDGR
jgi:hypothetical protein